LASQLAMTPPSMDSFSTSKSIKLQENVVNQFLI
jgi:hypothetical protein